jgi:hypothetical protein
MYDSEENFRVLSPAALTDYWIQDQAGNHLIDFSNALKDTRDGSWNGIFAIADGVFANDDDFGWDQLGLDYLGPVYPSSPLGGGIPSRRAGTPAASADFVSASGSEDSLDWYEDASQEMELRAEYPHRVYGRVAESGGSLWLQYWLFYYNNPRVLGDNNPFVGPHEGDWEMVQVGLDAGQSPDLAVAAQHGDGQQCDWANVLTAGERPIIYSALNSHASYFGPKEIGEVPFPWDQADGGGDVLFTPNVVRIADDTPRWLGWPGQWGDSDTSPRGPQFQGVKWINPTAWSDELGSC